MFRLISINLGACVIISSTAHLVYRREVFFFPHSQFVRSLMQKYLHGSVILIVFGRCGGLKGQWTNQRAEKGSVTQPSQTTFMLH